MTFQFFQVYITQFINVYFGLQRPLQVTFQELLGNFSIRVFCRVLPFELVEQEQKIQTATNKNSLRDEQTSYLQGTLPQH